MNPDVEVLKQLATEWDGQAPAFEEPPAIDGAAANAAEVLAKQILEGDRRIKAVPEIRAGPGQKERSSRPPWPDTRWCAFSSGPAIPAWTATPYRSRRRPTCRAS